MNRQEPTRITAANGPTVRGMDPAGVPVADLARLLRLSEEAIRRHIDQGAPTNADGTVNFIHYAAWLNQRLAGRTHGD